MGRFTEAKAGYERALLLEPRRDELIKNYSRAAAMVAASARQGKAEPEEEIIMLQVCSRTAWCTCLRVHSNRSILSLLGLQAPEEPDLIIAETEEVKLQGMAEPTKEVPTQPPPPRPHDNHHPHHDNIVMF